MGYMPDGNSLAERFHDRSQTRGERFMDEAQAERKELVDGFMDSEKNERQLLDQLGDLAGGDPEFLHALQRGDAARMQKLFHDCIDHAYGDELVERRASELETEA